MVLEDVLDHINDQMFYISAEMCLDYKLHPWVSRALDDAAWENAAEHLATKENNQQHPRTATG